MTRTIITPAALPASALAELKQWLGITIAADDAPLRELLTAALAVCEGFTGAMPLEQVCEEQLYACASWMRLATRPVGAITAVEQIGGYGMRETLEPETYAVELEPDGTGRVRLLAPRRGRIAVRFTAGLASDWDALPAALRHGIVRLAAHQHRERESSGASAVPPASVVALWRPFRRVRLA